MGGIAFSLCVSTDPVLGPGCLHRDIFLENDSIPFFVGPLNFFPLRSAVGGYIFRNRLCNMADLAFGALGLAFTPVAVVLPEFLRPAAQFCWVQNVLNRKFDKSESLEYIFDDSPAFGKQGTPGKRCIHAQPSTEGTAHKMSARKPASRSAPPRASI